MGKRGAKSPTLPSMLLAADRERRALRLRQQGWSYQRIGDELGITQPGALDCVRRALKKLQEECAEVAEEVRQLELDRLDAMLAGLWDGAETGDTAAIDRVLKIQERRARLLGLDAIVKVDVTTSDGIDAPLFVPLVQPTDGET